VRHQEGHPDDADEADRRDWGRRQDDLLVLYKLGQLEKRLDKLDQSLKERHGVVDNALKTIEDNHDKLTDDIADNQRRRDLEKANWKFLFALVTGASSFVGLLLGAGDKIKDFLKSWLT
jgi:hypothetical protein